MIGLGSVGCTKKASTTKTSANATATESEKTSANATVTETEKMKTKVKPALPGTKAATTTVEKSVTKVDAKTTKKSAD